MSEPLYARPTSVAEALELRAAHPDWMLLAGGTDLLVDSNHRKPPVGMLDLWRLAALGGIRQRDAAIEIGAGTTWLEIERHPLVRVGFLPLAEAAREIGARQIQARGTIGGNIGTSSPVGDSLPVLLALDAEIEVASVRGSRRVPYRDYCVGYRKTALAADELIIAVHLPTPVASTRMVWRKVGTRKAQSISKVMGAATMVLDGGTVVSARIGMGAVADRPIRLTAVEQAVVGLSLLQAAEAARAAVPAAIAPISDIRSTSDYRRAVAANLVARFFAV